jgi:hypothetical protein
MPSLKNLRIILFCFCCFGALLTLRKAANAQSAISIDLSKTAVEGGVRAPASATPLDVTYQGKQEQSVKLVMEHRAAYNSVLIPVEDVDAQKYNTLRFKVRFETASGETPDFQIWIVNKKGNWAATRFLKHAQKSDDGWYQFSWDMVNQPDVNAIDLSDLRQIKLRYGFEKIPEGKTDTLTLIDMNLLAGQSVQTGDPALYAQWKKFIADYKPDYSDSSKYLLPPETGRIASPVPFIKDGKALGEIVVPQNATAPLVTAGNELHHWLQAITKADVPIMATPNNNAIPKVLLGAQFAIGKFDADLKWLKDTGGIKGADGFAVRTDKNNIYIFGATDKGTLNGVFTFLENNTDIIWPRGLDEESVVFTPRSSLDIVWADARDMPAIALRGWGIQDPPGMLDWQTRNRNNYVAPEGVVVRSQAEILQKRGDYIQFGGGHNISGYLGKNPAFYPVIDGKQVTEFNIWKNQPNFTAPGITDAVANNVIQYIKGKAPEGIDCVNINIEDNWGLSTDPTSLAPIKLPDGTTITSDDPAFRSTQYFMFLNDVVKKINKVYPDLTISTYAYFFTATVPKVPLDPHIRIFFAPYPRKDYRSPLFSPINDHWWQQMLGWTKKTPNVVMREYYGIFNGFRPLAEVVDAEVKSYLAHGVTGYTAEIMGDATAIRSGALRGDEDGWNFMAMEYWVINRIYWNPNQDVEQLRKYFLRRTYHEAAPQMEKFFGAIRAAWYKQTAPSGFIDDGPSLMNDLVIPGGLENELRQDLVEAAGAVKNPQSRMMIDTLRMTFEEWIAAAKTKATGNSVYKFTPEVELRYGWQPMNDWEQSVPAWAMATYIEKDGKAIPAIRFTTHADRANGKDFTITNSFDPGLLLMKSGDTLEFTISPADKTALSAPLQISLTAIDKNNQKVLLPDSAVEKPPDGSLRVKWQLQSDEKFDVTQIKQLQLTIPNTICAGKTQAVFYITDMSLAHATD